MKILGLGREVDIKKIKNEKNEVKRRKETKKWVTIRRKERRMNWVRGLGYTQSVHSINSQQYCKRGESFWMIELHTTLSKEIFLNFTRN